MDNSPGTASAQLSSPLTATDETAEQTSQQSWWRRPYLRTLVAVGAIVAVVIALALIPLDKVVESPGPTWNVLASGENKVLEVTGTKTYQTDGALRMTTVSVRGCPGYPVSVLDVLLAKLDSKKNVLDRDQVCPESLSEADIDKIDQAQMTSSQSSAVVAALMETGLATKQILQVAGAGSDDTDKHLQTDDVLQAITTANGAKTTITTYTQLKQILAQITPGSTVTVTAQRQGKSVNYPVVTLSPADADQKGSILGVYLNISADSDVDAKFSLEDVGGPSAGMMFALGIVDEVTPDSLTKGLDIAGTGTIDPSGQVGAIGGIAQKMAGASAAGATVFLAPTSNCADVVGHEPKGMNVFAVSTLHEAVTTVHAAANGNTAKLLTCEQVVASDQATEANS